MATTQRGGLKGETRRGLLFPYDSFRNRVAVYRFVRDIPMHPFHPSYRVLTEIERKLPLLNEKPVQLLWGKQDFVFCTRFLDRWQEFFPEAKVAVLDRAGHYLLEDEPEQTSEIIESFFDEQE